MIYVFIILQLIYAAAIIFAYRHGLTDGYKLYKGQAVKDVKEKSIPPPPPGKDEIMRANIENYCGSAEGQVDYNV